MLVLTPLVALLAVLLFVAITAVSRYVSLGSMLGAVAACVLAYAFGHVQAAELYIALTLLIVAKHAGNIRRLFAGTAIKRTGRDRFVRNVAIALGNSQDARAVPALAGLLDDGSELVRAMAVWGLSRHLAPGEFARLRAARLEAEADAAVRAEWGA